MPCIGMDVRSVMLWCTWFPGGGTNAVGQNSVVHELGDDLAGGAVSQLTDFSIQGFYDSRWNACRGWSLFP